MTPLALVQNYSSPRPRTDTVVNIQYMLEVAFTCAVCAFAAADADDSKRVPQEATDALLELARWIGHLSAVPESPATLDSAYGVPLATIPTGDRGVAWHRDREGESYYRLWLVTHVRVTPLAAVIGLWPDDLPIRDNSGFPFLVERLSGFKLRAALSPLLELLADELQAIIAAGEGNLWTWSDEDEAHHAVWHPHRLLDAVRAMRRRIGNSASEGGAALGERDLPR